ncbi:PAQR family membrane homeostasis protein TrhA [Gehongia tenuis]|nr:hemolysin III family protein [Gehongia tenuis]
MNTEIPTKRKTIKEMPFYTLAEEIMNAVTHGVGALISLAGCVILIVMACLQRDAYKIVSAAIYGLSLVTLFTMSTLYHAITHPGAKRIFRIFDHTSIFVLIAGSYTPLTLVLLRESGWGWPIFAVVWTAALLGIVFNAISLERFKVFSMICYIASGWCIVVAIVPVIQNMATLGSVLLIAGGLCYTLGIIFYGWKRKYMHSIWHLFVLAGAILHYFCILFYVIMA